MFLVFISLISGLCGEGQIDINTATLVELGNIYGIGPVKAQAIINARPFESVNDLINSWGIGETTLESIISEGLACVNGYVEEEPEEEVVEINEEVIKDLVDSEEENIEQTQTTTPQVIQLNTPKDIKSEDNIEGLDKADYAKYGFIVFCILIGVLLILRNKKRQKYKD